MNILVVGGGGREHAIIHAIRKNKNVETIYALPGNGGIAELAHCVPIKTTDVGGIVDFAKGHDIHFAVVAPDDPLVLGAVDMLEREGIPCFGPTKAAAQIEGSKSFAKRMMQKYGIPTARYEVFDDEMPARSYIQSRNDFPVVIKADGLALGKGVLICENREEALQAVKHIMSDRAFGESGARIVVEEFLTGPEVSVLAFTDGKTLVPMVSSMDHKRAFDGNEGPNTGGMGAIAPNPYYTESVAKECMERIFVPTVRAMAQEGHPFIGCLYFGLMLTDKGPMVIEYNCRFGDPETQAVLPLMQSDLLTAMQAVRNGTLDETDVVFSDGASCCVVLASGGYPGKYEVDKEMTIDAGKTKGAFLFHAGTKRDGVLKTGGGRVMGVVSTAQTMQEAIQKAYAAAEGVSFEGMHMRRDIGVVQ